jgi:tetratricopeptide (TPR) repeat protein
MPSVSLCVIARDEEAMLGACLASARDAVDDMVVVDTGSRDATKRIAVQGGARVFDFTWCDDFSAARNDALRHARGQWILVLDADERLSPGSGKRLRAALAGATFDCGLLRLHDARRTDASLEDVVRGKERQSEVQLVPRLLRRADDLAFVDTIHEHVTPWLRRRGMKIAGVNADIVHWGATEQVVTTKAKIARNLRMLRARIERDPADLDAHGYLVHELVRSEAIEEARETAERAWAAIDAGGDTRHTPIHRLATGRASLLIGSGRFADARETIRVARARDAAGQDAAANNPDFAFLAAYASECEAERAPEPHRGALLRAAHDGYRDCLAFGGHVFAQSFVVGASSWRGWMRLGIVQLQLERPAEALRAFDASLTQKPDGRAAQLGQAEAMLDLGDAEGALRRLEKLLDDTSPDAWVLAAAAVRRLGQADDARLFVRRAHSLAGKGLVAPHRRARWREVASPPASKENVSHA